MASDSSPTNSPYDGGSDATDTATDVARGTANTDAAERNLADDGGASRSRSSARSDQYGHGSTRPDVRSRDAAPSTPVGASPHISLDEAREVERQVDKLIAEAPQLSHENFAIDALGQLFAVSETLASLIEQIQSLERDLTDAIKILTQQRNEAVEQLEAVDDAGEALAQGLRDWLRAERGTITFGLNEGYVENLLAGWSEVHSPATSSESGVLGHSAAADHRLAPDSEGSAPASESLQEVADRDAAEGGWRTIPGDPLDNADDPMWDGEDLEARSPAKERDS